MYQTSKLDTRFVRRVCFYTLDTTGDGARWNDTVQGEKLLKCIYRSTV